MIELTPTVKMKGFNKLLACKGLVSICKTSKGLGSVIGRRTPCRELWNELRSCNRTFPKLCELWRNSGDLLKIYHKYHKNHTMLRS